MNKLMIIISCMFVCLLGCETNQPFVKGCNEIDRIEIFAIGLSDISFPTSQTEESLRQNAVEIIEDKIELANIEKSIIGLSKDVKKNERFMGSLRGVCDVYCTNGLKYVLQFDNHVFKINNEFYRVDSTLIKQLFFN